MLTHGLHGAHGEILHMELVVGETRLLIPGETLHTDGLTGEVADLAV